MQVCWSAALAGQMNWGLLPDPYFALVERTNVCRESSGPGARPPAAAGGRVDLLAWPRPPHRINVRHPDGDRVVAIVKFASPGNRDSSRKVEHFARTVAAALDAGTRRLTATANAGGWRGAYTARSHRLAQVNKAAVETRAVGPPRTRRGSSR